MIQSEITLFPGNSTLIALRGLQQHDALDDVSWCNDATVTVTVYDQAGAQVSGQVWPLTLLYETGSNGIYSATVGAALNISDGDVLSTVVTATKSGQQLQRTVPTKVITRSNDTA